jgi:hypothetical protein
VAELLLLLLYPYIIIKYYCMSWIYWKTKETMLNFPESLNYFLCLMNVVTSQVLGWLGVLHERLQSLCSWVAVHK